MLIDKPFFNNTKQLHEFYLEESKSNYLDNWAKTSNFFARQDYYNWMVKTLLKYNQAPKRILDIGCGTGEGILALLKQFDCQIISLEENEKCIDFTTELLKEEGYSVRCIKRMTINCDEEFTPCKVMSYSNKYQKGKLKNLDFKEKVIIIQSDILDYKSDDELFKQIMQMQFDVITCWLIGTHLYHYCNENIKDNIAQEGGINLENFQRNNAYFVRQEVHRIVCELGDAILCNEGIVNIVERLDHEEYFNNKENIDSNYNCMIANLLNISFVTAEVKDYIQPTTGILMTNNKQHITNKTDVIKDFVSFFLKKQTPDKATE